ncbi:hypothetical protein KRZ98_19280 [Sphingobium sp. AS12]|uniref:hypothetical protein n=1 Tax=Sphingobium sp. AS12 TaxID=2849495 RepID=UPI001C31DA00|nr:hypothetical protein [Sphingobium sp. AS12]MBV2150349.1 hypothetical protein [Sphingobium sp. AS12]
MFCLTRGGSVGAPRRIEQIIETATAVTETLSIGGRYLTLSSGKIPRRPACMCCILSRGWNNAKEVSYARELRRFLTALLRIIFVANVSGV